MADYLIQDTSLNNIANGINDITGETAALSPAAMKTKLGGVANTVDSQAAQIARIRALLATKRGGGTLQPSKSYTATENGSFTIPPDSGYDGMEAVALTVNVPVPQSETKSVDLSMASGNQLVSASSGKLMSQVTVQKPATLIPANIKKDVNIGGVVGNFEGGGGMTHVGDFTTTVTDLGGSGLRFFEHSITLQKPSGSAQLYAVFYNNMAIATVFVVYSSTLFSTYDSGNDWYILATGGSYGNPLPIYREYGSVLPSPITVSVYKIA